MDISKKFDFDESTTGIGIIQPLRYRLPDVEFMALTGYLVDSLVDFGAFIPGMAKINEILPATVNWQRRAWKGKIVKRCASA